MTVSWWHFGVVFALVAVPSVGSATVLAQSDAVTTGFEAAASHPWYVQSGVAAVLTLVVGGGLIAVTPATTRWHTDRALENPHRAFVYGFWGQVAVFGTSSLLAITVVGAPLALLIAILGGLGVAIAGQFGYLAVGRLVADDWVLALGVALLVAVAVGAVPILGLLIGAVLSVIGTGTVVIGLLEEPAAE